jgi:hypothetical protein
VGSARLIVAILFDGDTAAAGMAAEALMCSCNCNEMHAAMHDRCDLSRMFENSRSLRHSRVTVAVNPDRDIHAG